MQNEIYGDLIEDGVRMDMVEQQPMKVITPEAAWDREHCVCSSVKTSVCVL